MKTLIVPLVAVAMMVASCTSTKQMSSAKSDDVYVTQTTPSPTPSSSSSGVMNDQSQDNYGSNEQQRTDDSYQSPDYSTTDQYTDPNGTNYITNNYYGNGGWYNSQLGSPYFGLSFSPYYSGFTFYDPFYFSPGFSFSIGFGFGYGYGYGYNPWYSPYGYYGYYNPWYGGYPGYGYCGGYYPYYPYYPYGGGYYDGYYGGYYGYYGYRGSSASNTSNDYDGGRHYKTDGGDDGSAPTGRTLTGGSLNSDLLEVGRNGRDINSGVVKQQDVNKSIKNSGSNSRSIESDNSRNIQFSNPDQNIRNIQHDQSPSNDRNVTPDRNNITPRENSNQNHPRNMAQMNSGHSQVVASSANHNRLDVNPMLKMNSSNQQHQGNVSRATNSQPQYFGNQSQSQNRNYSTMSRNYASTTRTYSTPSRNYSLNGNHSSSSFKVQKNSTSRGMSQPSFSHQNSYQQRSGGGYSGGGGARQGNISSPSRR